MIEFLILFLLPSFLSLILYYCLKPVKPEKKRLSVLYLLSLFYLLLVLILLSGIFGLISPGIHNVIITFAMIAFGAACPAAIAMNIYPGIFPKKSEPVAAFITPIISIPFIFALIFGDDIWPGKIFGNNFTTQLPLFGWIIDIFTKEWVHGEEMADFLSGIIYYFGFFLQMTIIMLIFFWYLQTVTDKTEIISENEAKTADENRIITDDKDEI
jgi:hypothetical protein